MAESARPCQNKRETKTNKKHERDGGGGGTTIPESVAETPETEERPAGEALHLGMPLKGGQDQKNCE